VRIGIPVPTSGTGVLARAVVQPASGPAAPLMEMRDVMFVALTRVNALFIIYHSHTPDGRGPGGNRPRSEQLQLNPASTAEDESCGVARLADTDSRT
jgi:hypothetical protein